MVARRGIKVATSSGDSNDDDYKVGYGKPPRHSHFRPGRSGNPAGRPKGLRNLATDVKRTLRAPVKVKENGRTRTRSSQETALMVLREKALRGDARALDRLVDLGMRFNNDPAEVGQAQPLPADDQAILAAFVAERVAEFTAAATTPAAAKSSHDQTSKPSGGPGKKSPK